MKSTNEPTVKQMATFLSDYSVLLFGSGATCIRMDKNVRRIAASTGMKVEFSILPRHIHITVEKGDESITSVAAIEDLPVSFSIIASLSRLSWQMADGSKDFETAGRELARIASSGAMNPWLLLVLVSLANASFCRLFGGDIMAMAVVFAATFGGFMTKQICGERHIDNRIAVVLSSFIASVIASADGLFGLSTTPDVSLGTSVLFLVPGIPFINSFCDFIDRHYLCSFGRMMNAIVISCCLSIGLCAGMMLMNMGMF